MVKTKGYFGNERLESFLQEKTESMKSIKKDLVSNGLNTNISNNYIKRVLKLFPLYFYLIVNVAHLQNPEKSNSK